MRIPDTHILLVCPTWVFQVRSRQTRFPGLPNVMYFLSTFNLYVFAPLSYCARSRRPWAGGETPRFRNWLRLSCNLAESPVCDNSQAPGVPVSWVSPHVRVPYITIHIFWLWNVCYIRQTSWGLFCFFNCLPFWRKTLYYVQHTL